MSANYYSPTEDIEVIRVMLERHHRMADNDADDSRAAYWEAEHAITALEALKRTAERLGLDVAGFRNE